MAGEWKEAMLADVSSDVAYGYTESASDEKVGPRFLRITDIQNGVVDWANVPYCPISPENHRKYRLQACDIVVARTGNSTGENFLYRGDEDAVFASYLIRFRIDRQKADPEFIWYNLRSRDWWNFISSSKTGSAQAGANAKILGLFPLDLPPLDEQKAIAAVLGALDRKIELNRRMNETLETMARALFKSWFVDFDPVRAKAEVSDTGLPKPLADMFPDSFEDSDLGEIPKGWNASALGQEVTRCGGRIQTGPFGSQLHASDYVADGVPVVMPKDLLRRRVSTRSIARIALGDAERLSRHRLQEGDIVYSRRGDVERHGLVSNRETGWLCGTGCLLVRLGPEWPSPLFTSFALDRPETRAWIVQHAIGATMPNLNTGILARVPIVVPTDKLLRAFNRFTQPLADRVIESDAKTETLVSLRDTLLPKLISGEVRLRSADKLVAEVV